MTIIVCHRNNLTLNDKWIHIVERPYPLSPSSRLSFSIYYFLYTFDLVIYSYVANFCLERNVGATWNSILDVPVASLSHVPVTSLSHDVMFLWRHYDWCFTVGGYFLVASLSSEVGVGYCIPIPTRNRSHDIRGIGHVITPEVISTLPRLTMD